MSAPQLSKLLQPSFDPGVAALPIDATPPLQLGFAVPEDGMG